MIYALIKDGAIARYPYSFADLRKDNPDVSFPREPSSETLAQYGLVEVKNTDRPATADVTKNVQASVPVNVKGVWTQAWTEVDASPEEIAERTKQASQDANLSEVKRDAFVDAFVKLTPAQVIARMDTDITNLNSAKTIITKLALMVLILARNEFSE